MVDILNTAIRGLMAFRAGMATTGHNVANVNTPYFSRQRVELGATTPEKQSYGYMGTGVNVESVTRAYDDFVMKQLRGHTSGVSQYEELNDLTNQLSALLGDTDVGLTPDLEAFFGSLQDLADSPTSITARQVFLDEGETLTNRIQDIDDALNSLRDSIDTSITNTVATINDYSQGIAEVNRAVAQAADSDTNPPNDLLDRRDKLLVDLSKLAGIQVVAEENGALNVFLSNGQPLVVGINTQKLVAVQSGFDPGEVTVRLEGQAEGSDLERYITSGELGAYFEFRRTILNPAQDGLGLLAMGLAETFNEQHQQGMDLDGNLGEALFNVGAPRVLSHTTNNDDNPAIFSAALNNTKERYELSFSAASNYTLTRLSDGVIVASNFTLTNPLTVDGVTVELSSGATVTDGDRFLLQPTAHGATATSYNGNNAGSDVVFQAKALPVADSSNLARSDYEILTSGVASRATLTNAGNATISTPTIADLDDENLTNTVRIRFTNATTYDVIDDTRGVTLASGQAYTSGATIPATGDYNGWNAAITDGTSPIQAGDTFIISAGYTVKRLSDSQELLSSGDLTALNDVMRDEGLHLALRGGPAQYGDRFLVQPTRLGSANFEMALADPRKVAVAAPITTTATATNLGSGVISAGNVIDSSRMELQNRVEIRFTSDHTFNVFDLDTDAILDKGVVFPPLVAQADADNSGTAGITAPAIVDYEAERLRNTIEIRFLSATQYEIVDVTTGDTLTPAGGSPYTSGNAIDLNALDSRYGSTFQISGAPVAGDRFEIKSTTSNAISYNGWEVNITGEPHGDIIASPGSENTGTGTIEKPLITDYQADNLTHTVKIRFTSATAYDLLDMTDNGVTISAGNIYTPPGGAGLGTVTPPAGYGWTVDINNDPQAGDEFIVQNDGDTFQIKSNQGGIGDNRNALELVKLETTPQLLDGNDFRGVYAQMIAEVGAQGRRVENTLQSQEALLQQSELSRESISGVSLDEEAANLVRFQQAYQAAAQVIQTSNSMFTSLLEAVKG
ncbi:MAG: flagellar hook-associated protein FlgK [Candidatus Competibacteraceae bacterium]|nr:flagellar hook-associated protein FlgK [Candidatus Competibacteraceae bacterium]MCP5125177.1 flagellar hook-associated protein FlgK [Gammaproteobacteria bacterium]HRX72214.1 flagellar hook-associated protein FlgK [Candidatus Competibacteraceae bacterium]